MENRLNDTMELCFILDNAITAKANVENDLFCYLAEAAPSEEAVTAMEITIATLHDAAIHWADLIDARIR